MDHSIQNYKTRSNDHAQIIIPNPRRSSCKSLNLVLGSIYTFVIKEN
jgi:hypothetical protein